MVVGMVVGWVVGSVGGQVGLTGCTQMGSGLTLQITSGLCGGQCGIGLKQNSGGGLGGQ
jgi:hypothetical protein